MKKNLCAAFVAAVGALGLAACDAASPPETAVSRPVEPEASARPEVIAAREAIADVLRDKDAFARARRLGALIPTLAPEAVPAVRETLRDESLDYGATEVELLLRFWATHQPEEASRWAVVHSPWMYRLPAILSSLTLWAEADPQAALDATQRWSWFSGRTRDALLTALVRGWFARNPSEVDRYIQRMGVSFDRQRAIATYIRAMILNQGIDAAMRWAVSLSDEDLAYKKAAYRQVAVAVAGIDHDAAMRWYEAHGEGPYGGNLLSIMARRWAERDGAAALAWVASKPEGPARSVSLRGAFFVWGSRDLEEAGRWLEAQTRGEPAPWIRNLVPVYTLLLSRVSPAEAIEWAERIEDDVEREDLSIRVAQQWRLVDEAAAEAWLLQSSLSEEARERARRPPRIAPVGRI